MKHATLVAPSFSSGDAITLVRKGTVLKAILTCAMERIHRWHMLSRERHLLMTLSDAQLKDIGVSRADALREASRPFWDDAAIRR